MTKLTDNIIALRESGLISNSEARASLRRLSKQAQFNADYADHVDSHKRWTKEARAASLAARVPGFANVITHPKFAWTGGRS